MMLGTWSLRVPAFWTEGLARQLRNGEEVRRDSVVQRRGHVSQPGWSIKSLSSFLSCR